MSRTAILCAALVLMAGCSSQELYLTGQGWREQECRKLPDLDERQRCLKSAALSYQQYQAERDAAKAGKTAP